MYCFTLRVILLLFSQEGSLLKKFSSDNFEIGDEILTDPEVFSYLVSFLWPSNALPFKRRVSGDINFPE